MSSKFVILKSSKKERRINISDIGRVYSRAIKKLPKLPKYIDSDTEVSSPDFKYDYQTHSKAFLSSSVWYDFYIVLLLYVMMMVDKIFYCFISRT